MDNVTLNIFLALLMIPLNVLSDIHNYFAEEINESLMKNNKENNNG